MVFCRFCAEQKPYADVKVLQEDRVSVIEKLSLFGVVFVDFSNKMLPETVCCACSEHINVSYEFYLKVKRSQVVLSKICGVEVETEICLQDNKLAGYVAVKEESYDDGEYLRGKKYLNAFYLPTLDTNSVAIPSLLQSYSAITAMCYLSY